MIEETTEYLRETYNIKKISFLDLAVGRGGDMRKWYDNKIYNVVGVDIDDKSINGENGAKDRYRGFIKFLKKKRKFIPKYEFHVLDLSDPNNIPRLDKIIGNRKFNVVSCQFAIHYFFRTKETLDTFINIVSRYMDRNAFFIGTTMDGFRVHSLFENNDIVEKDIYYFENKTTIEDLKTPYGNTYLVSLGKKDEDDDHYFVNNASLEYMVDIDELKKICTKYGLVFIGSKSFTEWYGKYNGSRLGYQEKEFSFLNFSFVFKKVS